MYYFLRKPVFSLYAACSSPGSPAAAATRIRELSNGGKNFSSSRISIWQYSIEGIFSSFRAALFGFTPNSVSDMILQASHNRHNVAYTHNQFLEVAAAEGVPGLCLFLAWLALMLRDIYRLVFVQKNRTVLLAVPVVFLTLLLANMAEAHLIYYDHINGYAFFFLGGLLHGAVNDPPAPGALPRPRLIRTLRKRKA